MIEFAYIARVRHFVELALHGQAFLFTEIMKFEFQRPISVIIRVLISGFIR